VSPSPSKERGRKRKEGLTPLLDTPDEYTFCKGLRKGEAYF